MFIVKATNKDVVVIDEATDVVYEESYTDFVKSIARFVDIYGSELWDHVDLIDSETGEVYAYFNAEPFEVWASDETKPIMLGFVLSALLGQN